MKLRSTVLIMAALSAVGMPLLSTAEEPVHGNMSSKPMQMGTPNAMAEKKMERGECEKMMASWPEPSKMAVMATMEKYGAPDEMTATHATWMHNGPWKWTCVSNMPTDHQFPAMHQDVMEQAIDYKVPPEMFSKLAMYDGSVTARRTQGELTARCDKEGANFLALNLANDIITNKRTVEQARDEYAAQIKAMKAGQSAPLTEKLMFTPMTADSTADADKPAMTTDAGK